MKQSSPPLRYGDVKNLLRGLILSVLENAVRAGSIDPKGKSDAELIEEFKQIVRATRDANITFTEQMITRRISYQKRAALAGQQMPG